MPLAGLWSHNGKRAVLLIPHMIKKVSMLEIRVRGSRRQLELPLSSCGLSGMFGLSKEQSKDNQRVPKQPRGTRRGHRAIITDSYHSPSQIGPA